MASAKDSTTKPSEGARPQDRSPFVPQKKPSIPFQDFHGLDEQEVGTLGLGMIALAICFAFIATTTHTWVVEYKVPNTDKSSQDVLKNLTAHCKIDVNKLDPVCYFNANSSKGFKLGLSEWCHFDRFLLKFDHSIVINQNKGQCYPIETLWKASTKDSFITKASGNLCKEIGPKIAAAVAFGIIGGVVGIIGFIILFGAMTSFKMMATTQPHPSNEKGRLLYVPYSMWTRVSGILFLFASLCMVIQFAVAMSAFKTTCAGKKRVFYGDTATNAFTGVPAAKVGQVRFSSSCWVSVTSFVFYFVVGLFMAVLADNATPNPQNAMFGQPDEDEKDD